MAKRDYYEILGVDRNADEAAIKKVYRNLAMKYHPDRNPGDDQAAERMKEINEAYAILSNGKKRRLYDTYGHAGLEGYTAEDIFRGVDFTSIFRDLGLRDLFGGFGFGESIFDSFFGGRRTARGPQRGADLRYDLEITLEEAYSGAEKKIILPGTERCPDCNGTGAKKGKIGECEYCHGTGQIVKEQRSGFGVFRQITTCGNCGGTGKVIKEPCDRCGGKGIIETRREITVSIPKGADTGHTIRVKGEGEPGEQCGDLYVVLQVKRHPIFERHGDDIYVGKEVSFTQAALGSKINNIPSLKGEVSIDIPEGTQTGTVLRMVNKGMPHLNHFGRGDQYIVIKVVTPTGLTPEEKELLVQLESSRMRRPKR